MSFMMSDFEVHITNRTFSFANFPYESQADKRTQGWLLVASPWNVAALVTLYLLIVLYMPKWMKSRKPFKLKALLIVYNMAMAALNAHICKELYQATRQLNYNYWCEPCHVSYNEQELRLATAVWWFYFSKLLEFADTIFFILRKKTEQLSFLHIYHHSTMFPLQWLIIKWLPTGSSFFPCMLNSFVHVIMYMYYGLSVLGPSVRKYLWWKRHLTTLQLLQFTIGIIYSVHAILSDCDFPHWTHYTTICYMLTFLYLFGRFYAHTYNKKHA